MQIAKSAKKTIQTGKFVLSYKGNSQPNALSDDVEKTLCM